MISITKWANLCETDNAWYSNLIGTYVGCVAHVGSTKIGQLNISLEDQQIVFRYGFANECDHDNIFLEENLAQYFDQSKTKTMIDGMWPGYHVSFEGRKKIYNDDGICVIIHTLYQLKFNQMNELIKFRIQEYNDGTPVAVTYCLEVNSVKKYMDPTCKGRKLRRDWEF